MKPAKANKNAEWLEKLYEEGQISKKPQPLQEPSPDLYPDLMWIWEAYCFLADRRGMGPNGPAPISMSDIHAYSEMTGRVENEYRRQLLRFIPPLDRFFLKDFYDKQHAEFEKRQKKASRARR